jgi:hypothetical protein
MVLSAGLIVLIHSMETAVIMTAHEDRDLHSTPRYPDVLKVIA